MSYKVTAIILSWNTNKIVEDSVMRLLREGHKVVVVDNGSMKPLKKQDGAIYIENKTNLGLGVGRNQALAHQEGDVFSLDGDILYVPGSIDKMRKYLYKKEEVGCVGFEGDYNRCGVPIRDMADRKAYRVYFRNNNSDWAWGAYGLYKEKAAKQCWYDVTGPMGVPGYGWDDHDQLQCLLYNCWEVWTLGGLRFYHQAHSSKKELNNDLHEDERKEYIQNKWKRIWAGETSLEEEQNGRK